MSKQTINIGASPNDGTGTPLRTSFDYTNQNFTELYTALGGGVGLPGATTQVIFNDGGTNLAGDAGLVYNKTTDALTVGGLVTAGSATITGDLTVDTSTLKVNSSTDRVGIKTTNLFKPLTVEAGSTGAATINQGLVINSSAAYGVGQGVSYSSLVFGRNRVSDTGSLIASCEIFGGNVLETSSDGGVLGFSTSTTSGTLTERYRIDNTGVATWSNVGGTSGTAMTLNSTGLGVGIVPSSFGRFSVQGTAGGAGILGMNTDATQCDIQSYNKPLALNRAGNNITMCEGGGNVGIGVTPNTWSAAYKFLMLPTGGSLFNDTTNSIYLAANYYALAGSRKIASGYALNLQLDAAAGAYKWFTSLLGAGTAGDAVSFNQAMTLDASGNLLVGKTSIGTTVGIEVRPDGYLVATRSATTDGAGFTNAVYSSGAAAYRFYVGMGGTVSATNTTISAISDARFKENVQDIDVGLGAILALKPRKFDWKAGKGKDIKGDRGFIAQEFETVFPQLVDEWADPAPEGEAPYKSVRQDLIPVLVKAIQELTARVQTLEAR